MQARLRFSAIVGAIGINETVEKQDFS